MTAPIDVASRPRRLGPGRWAGGAGVFALALLVRLAFAVPFANHPLGAFTWVDEAAYWDRAQEIRAGRWLPERPFYQDPLWPYLLALWQSIVGVDVPRLRVVMAIVGSVTPVLVYVAGRRGFGRVEGLLAGGLTAICAPMVFTDGCLEKEGLGAALAAAALAVMAPARAVPAVVAASGLLWGATALVRANALALAPLGALWWAVDATSATIGAWRRACAGLAFAAAFALALLPVALANARVGAPGDFVLTTWQAGANFYIGNGPQANGTYAAPPFVVGSPEREAGDFAAEARRRTGRRLAPGAVSRFWFGEGLDTWSRAPAASLSLLLRKLVMVVNRVEVPDNQDPAVVRLVCAPALGWSVVGLGLLVPLAALGLPVSVRRPFGRWLVVTVVVGLGSTAVFFVVGRYRVPWLPGLALLAAVGGVASARLIRERSWGRLGRRVLVLGLPAGLLAWWPLPDLVPGRWAHAELRLALASLQAGRLDEAIAAFDDARCVSPILADRVAALLGQGPLHETYRGLATERAARIALDGPQGELELVRLLRNLESGRAEARRRLEALRARLGDDPRVLREWGALALCDGSDTNSRREAERALVAAADGDFEAAIMAALVTRDRGRLPIPHPGMTPAQAVRSRLARAFLTSEREGGVALANPHAED